MKRRMKITKDVKDLLLEYQKLINNHGCFTERHDELCRLLKDELLNDNIALMWHIKEQKFVILVNISETEARLIEHVIPEE